MKTRSGFAVMVADECDARQLLTRKSRQQKMRASEVIFDALAQWNLEHFAMGSSAEVSEKSLKKGLKAVREKFSKMSSADCETQYQVPLLLIIGMIPKLIEIISAIFAWWTGA